MRASSLTHPVVQLAAAVIVVNDAVLREVVPGWLTGKLSDVGWLVVVPVLLAEALTLLRVRRARPLAIGVTATFYTVLQLWPPLGALFGPGHVADAGDLLALPALAGAIYAWRGARSTSTFVRLALGIALVGVIAGDSLWAPLNMSWPCGNGMVWPTASPLRLELSSVTAYSSDTFVRGLTLRDAVGTDIPLIVANDSGYIAVCARDGLQPSTAYTWTIGPWDQHPGNEVEVVDGALPTVHFSTDSSRGAPAADVAGCEALVGDHPTGDTGVWLTCQNARWEDTGGHHDTGSTTDTGDSGAGTP